MSIPAPMQNVCPDYFELTDLERKQLDDAILWLAVSLKADSIAIEQAEIFDLTRNALAAKMIAARPEVAAQS